MKRPTIVFVTDVPCWGGSTLSLKDLLVSLGNKIIPIVLVYKRDEVYDYMASNGIKCYVIPYRLSTFIERNKKYVWLHQIYTSVKYKIKIRKGLRLAQSLLRDENVDFVHSNTSAVDFGYRLSRELGVKHVWHIREMLETFHDTYYIGGFYRLKKKMEKSDMLVFISNACAIYWGVKNTNSIVIGDAVRSRRDVIYKNKKKYFLFCSYWLNDFKGADLAIQAFGKSKLAAEGYCIKMIGTYFDEYKEKLEFISSQYGIKDKVEFLGIVEYNDVKEYMSEATAFLQCGELEGLGRTAIEAMFYGCPVIARNCGGTLDFVEHKVTGFLWDTVDEMSSLMIYVSQHDTNEIIRKAQENVIEKYSIENYGALMMDVYRKLL